MRVMKDEGEKDDWERSTVATREKEREWVWLDDEKRRWKNCE